MKDFIAISIMTLMLLPLVSGGKDTFKQLLSLPVIASTIFYVFRFLSH